MALVACAPYSHAAVAIAFVRRGNTQRPSTLTLHTTFLTRLDHGAEHTTFLTRPDHGACTHRISNAPGSRRLHTSTQLCALLVKPVALSTTQLCAPRSARSLALSTTHTPHF